MTVTGPVVNQSLVETLFYYYEEEPGNVVKNGLSYEKLTSFKLATMIANVEDCH